MRGTDSALELTPDEMRQAVANIVRQPIEDIAHFVVLVQTQDGLTIWRTGGVFTVKGTPPNVQEAAAAVCMDLTAYQRSLLMLALGWTEPVK